MKDQILKLSLWMRSWLYSELRLVRLKRLDWR